MVQKKSFTKYIFLMGLLIIIKVPIKCLNIKYHDVH